MTKTKPINYLPCWIHNTRTSNLNSIFLRIVPELSVSSISVYQWAHKDLPSNFTRKRLRRTYLSILKVIYHLRARFHSWLMRGSTLMRDAPTTHYDKNITNILMLFCERMITHKMLFTGPRRSRNTNRDLLNIDDNRMIISTWKFLLLTTLLITKSNKHSEERKLTSDSCIELPH